MSQLSHAQFPLRRHPNLLVDHRRNRSAAVAEPRGANGEAVTGSGGRLHFGMVADIKSERWPTSNRNPRPDCLGIRTIVASNISSVPANILMTLSVFSGLYDFPMIRRTASSEGSGIATFDTWCAVLAMVPCSFRGRSDLTYNPPEEYRAAILPAPLRDLSQASERLLALTPGSAWSGPSFE